MGCVLTAGLGQNPARQAALRGVSPIPSLPRRSTWCAVPASKPSRWPRNPSPPATPRSSSPAAWSPCPTRPTTSRRAHRLPYRQLRAFDSMIHDGLWCATEDEHMGLAAERVAEKYSITRAEQDAYALESHRRAALAQRDGRFAVEIVSVTLPAPSSSRRSDTTRAVFSRDECIRDAALDHPAAALAALAALRPAFNPMAPSPPATLPASTTLPRPSSSCPRRAPHRSRSPRSPPFARRLPVASHRAGS